MKVFISVAVYFTDWAHRALIAFNESNPNIAQLVLKNMIRPGGLVVIDRNYTHPSCKLKDTCVFIEKQNKIRCSLLQEKKCL